MQEVGDSKSWKQLNKMKTAKCGHILLPNQFLDPSLKKMAESLDLTKSCFMKEGTMETICLAPDAICSGGSRISQAGWCANTGGGHKLIIWPNIYRKLHENERNWIDRGGTRPFVPSWIPQWPGSANALITCKVVHFNRDLQSTS